MNECMKVVDLLAYFPTLGILKKKQRQDWGDDHSVSRK